MASSVAVLRARQLLKDKRYADALQVCTDELALGADDPQLRLVAAHSLLAQGRHEGAKKEAQQVLRLDPDQAEAHRILADVACTRGELGTACEHLERVLDLVSGDERARALLETLTKPSAMPTGSEPDLALQATTLERFLAQAPATGADPEAELSDAILGDLVGADDVSAEEIVSDSMLVRIESAGGGIDDQMPQIPESVDQPAPPGLDTLHDRVSSESTTSWRSDAARQPAMDAGAGSGARKYQGTLRLPALDEQGDDEAPTMPLLRASPPPEPQLRLDPLASEPVRQQQADGSQPLTGASFAAGSDPTEPSSGASAGVPKVTAKREDSFDDFEVEAASVPMARPEPQPIPAGPTSGQVPSGKASGRVASGGGGDPLSMMMSGGRADDTGGGVDDTDDRIAGGGAEDSGAFEAGDGTSGLMDMLAGGDPSLPRIESRKPARRREPTDSGWDPLAEAEAPGAADASMERELAAAGFDTAAERTGSARRTLAIIAAVLLVAGGVGGYLWYRSYKYIQAEWGKARAGIHLGTPEGFRRAREAAARILEKRANSAKARAAQAVCDAAMAIEFGEDRLASAKKLLDQTRGTDSEWRTAAQGYLALIDDPTRGSGYLRKGTEVFPESALLQYLHGRTLAASGELERAAKSLQAAIKLQPSYVAAQIHLSVLLGTQESGYPQAASELDAIIKAHPTDIQALIERARLSARHGKELGLAADLAHKVVGELAEKGGRGQIGWAQLVLAQIGRRRGEIGVLTQALDEAIKAPPCCDSQYRFELAGELQQVYRYSEAAQQMEAALQLKAKQPEYLQRMAEVLLDMDRPKQAAKYIERAPARQLRTRLLSGRAAYALGNYSKAEKVLKQVLLEHKDEVEAMLYLALTEAAKGERKAALARLSAAQTAHPTDHRLPQTVGLIEFKEAEYGSAEKALRAAWRLNGLDPRTPTLLAWVSMKSHDLARAEKRFNTALARRPDFGPAHIGLALLRMKSGQLAEARKQASMVSEPDQSRAGYAVMLARLDLAEGKLSDAQQNIGRAEGAGADALQVAHLRGLLALAQGQHKEAVKLLTAARRGDPKDADLLVALGRAQTGAKQEDAGFDSLQLAIKYDPGHPIALLELGRLAVVDGEYALAVKNISKALEQMKKRGRSQALQAQAFTALSRAYLAKGDTGRSISNLQDAMDLDQNAAEPHLVMGMTYVRLDRPERAVRYFLKAIELDAELADAYLQAGKAYAKLKDGASAAQYLQAYLAKAPAAARGRAEAKRLLRGLQ